MEEECQMVMELYTVPYAMGQPEKNLSDLLKPVFLVTLNYYSTLTFFTKYTDYLKTNGGMDDL